MTTEAAGAKLCCKCGKDLAGAQRMKDSDGRYWCPNCHEEDRLVKKYGFAEAGKSASSAAAAGDPARAKKIKIMVLVAALVAAAVLLNMFVF